MRPASRDAATASYVWSPRAEFCRYHFFTRYIRAHDHRRSCVRIESGVRLTSRDARGGFRPQRGRCRSPASSCTSASQRRARRTCSMSSGAISGRLADRGVLLPGYTRRDHSRASRDLRETPRLASDPADPWIGEWDVPDPSGPADPRTRPLSRTSCWWRATPRQADRAVRSLCRPSCTSSLTVRDFAGLLPAEWQESVKTRRTVSWEAVARVTSVEITPAADRRSRSWFWTAHDTLATSRHVVRARAAGPRARDHHASPRLD